MIKRSLLLLYAVALTGLFQYGFLQWRKSSHSLSQAWAILHQDWLVLITFVDATQFTLLVLAWLAHDLRKQALPVWEKLSWFALILGLGTPGLFFYLALRRRPRIN